VPVRPRPVRRRPVRRARPVAVLTATAVLVTGGAALALTATTVDSTAGLSSTKALTLGTFEEQRGLVQAQIEQSPNGSGPGYYASDNVTFHRTSGRRPTASAARGRRQALRHHHQGPADLRHLHPTKPVRQGLTTVDVEFENEQVPTDGRILGISGQTSSVTTQAAPCTADVEASRGCLLLFDVRDATAPKLVQSIKSAGDHTSTCLTVAGRTCAWMYGSSGSVSDIRTALDPGAAPIAEKSTNWLTTLHAQLRAQGWTGALPTRTHHQTEVRPGVLLTASVPQMLITVNAGEGGSPEAPKLLSYASHLAAPDNRTRFVHSVEHPQAGAASVMLSGGETNAQPTCGPDNGAFSTFTVKSGKSTAPVYSYASTYS
jgi:hypothetical protein